MVMWSRWMRRRGLLKLFNKLMIVVDIETSGVDSEKHSILSIGAVDFDKPENEFYIECRVWDGAKIEDEALAINGFTVEGALDPKKISEREAVQEFLSWLEKRDDHTFAGQNISFDMSFVLSAAKRAKINASIPKRSIDMHAVCYAHMIQRGLVPPLKNKRTDLDSDKIMEYVGIPPEKRPHVAINGARIEAEALSRLLYNKNLYEEYRKFSIPWL